MTIQDALRKYTILFKSHSFPSASLDAEVLLLETLGRRRKDIGKSWLYAHNDYVLDKKEEKILNQFVKRRLRHEPVAYITNRKEFYGYDFYVDKNVLIPRPETELIVDKALEMINSGRFNASDLNLIDIGAGSGCIIISILNELRKRGLNNVKSAVANDISKRALNISKLNAKRYGLDAIKFISGDFEKALSGKYVGEKTATFITANLPYVKTDNFKILPSGVRKFEPKIALVGGRSGLEIIQRLIRKIAALKSASRERNFIIFLEADPRQMASIKKIARKEFGVSDIQTIKDLRGKTRTAIIDTFQK